MTLQKCAIVTGAAGGIGQAAVQMLEESGHRVVGLDRVEAAGCDRAISCDLSDDVSVEQAGALIREEGITPSAVVHCAALCEVGGTIETPAGTWLDHYNVNLVGAVRLIQAVVPDMIAAGHGGAIVFVSSINAQVATPTLAAYAASKAALDSLTKTLALELAEYRIRVNAVAPASVDTPLLRSGFANAPNPQVALDRNVERHPLGRIGTADDVANLIAFLVSDRSQWITGTVQPIDGGALVTRW